MKEYLIASGVMSLFCMLIWSKDTLANAIIKLVFALLTIWAAVLLFR